jgi:glycosyltransferase involved in cell wall biosynthesis
MLSGLSGSVQFDIYGFCEDKSYWNYCKSLIKALPSSIKTSYYGAVLPEEVFAIFSRYHLFFFPTMGENFGHVIPEALSSGCLVLISDQTPWRGISEKEIGWDLPLDDRDEFRNVLETLVGMDNDEFSRRSLAAISFIQSYLKRQRQELHHAYKSLFEISFSDKHNE